MGAKGDKLTTKAGEVSFDFVDQIAPLGDITRKAMFGGYGIFEGGKMFALTDSTGEIFLKVGDANRQRFEDAGAQRHGRMPYYSIPDDVLDDTDLLFEWTRTAIEQSKLGK